MNLSIGASGVGRLATLVLLLVMAIVLHAAALRAPFVGDDFAYLEQASARSWSGALVERDPAGDGFRPVGRQLYFALVSKIGMGTPEAAHTANLALFVFCLAALAWVTWVLAGSYAATLAVAIVAFHYAAAVPVLWASGAQDLIALAAALLSIAFYIVGLRPLAALALFVGLLANETVLLAPIVAIAAAPRPAARDRKAHPLRDAWPLLAAIGVWALLWVGAFARHQVTLPRLSAFSPSAILASFVHLGQVVLGLEWMPKARIGLRVGWFEAVLIAVAVLVLVWAGARRRRTRAATSSRGERTGPRAIAVGSLWALAGTLPLIASQPNWSAHLYLFPLCGAALAIGAWASRQARWFGPTLVAILGLCSQNTLRLEGVATRADRWSTLSHVDRYSLSQDMAPVARYVRDLKRLHRQVPRRSTMFFAAVPRFWEAGGGRLVRWAYRDSSLRVYDLSVFSRDRVRRGPAYFIRYQDGRFEDIPVAELRDQALAGVRGREGDAGREMLSFVSAARPDDRQARYWLAWVEWARGDTSAAIEHLARLGMKASLPFKWEGSWAAKALALGDTSQAIDLLNRSMRHQPLDADIHRRMAALTRGRPQTQSTSEVEAFAARTLSRRPRSRRSDPVRSAVETAAETSAASVH